MNTTSHFEPASGGSAVRADSGITLNVVRDHAEIVFNTPNEKVNKLSRGAFLQLYEHLTFLKAKASEIKTVMIYSSKKDMFVAGADIEEIEGMTKREDAQAMVEKAQEVFQTLADLPQVTLAAIDGICLGGGLELALACKYRICSDSPSTRLGLPEVQLGVLPGAGGTQRLPRVIGLVNALTMITSAQMLDGKKALRMGLVSDLIPQEYLLETGRKILRDKTYLRWIPKESIGQWIMEHSPFKKMVFSKARKTIMEKTNGMYPAPLRIVDVIEATYGESEIRKGLAVEAEAFTDLALTPESKNLIHLFFSSEELKKERGVGAGEAVAFKPKKLSAIGVLGAGVMGGGIAAVAAGKGEMNVRLRDISNESIMNGLRTARGLFDKEFKRKKVSRSEYLKRIYRIEPTTDWSGFSHLPLVIEAVVEKMEIKKSVLAELEKLLPETAIIASNTSSLSFSAMASALQNPSRFVGMHFFNPVPLMPLVEVIRADKTSPETVMQTVALAKQLGKTPIVVKDRPGFLVNRVLMPFLIESGHLREEGYSIDQIDRAATKFGMPMGPFRLMDEIGLDTGEKVADSIASAYPHMKVLPMIKDMVAKGFLGKKNGRGFYNYDDKGKARGVREEFKVEPHNPSDTTERHIQDRLILPMVAEAVMALDDGTVSTLRDLETGLIYGIGFPPFRGGLLRWVSEVGERNILDRMYALHQATKGRLIVPKVFENHVHAGQSYYPQLPPIMG